MTLVVGIPACAKTFEKRVVYSTNPRVADVLLNAVGALPIAIQPVGEAQIGVLDRIDVYRRCCPAVARADRDGLESRRGAQFATHKPGVEHDCGRD